MTNATLIEMHLEEMLRETNQFGFARWFDVLSYCIGYYGEVTTDHIKAVKNLEQRGLLKS